MSAFAGVVIFDDAVTSTRRYEEPLLAIMGRHGPRPRIQRSARAIIVNADPSGPPGNQTTLFAASARLDNREQIAAETGLRAGAGDASLVRRHFELRGDRGIAQLLGAFAFAHWHEPSGRLTLARDCPGERSLFFHRGDGFVAFASLLADLLAMPRVPRELDETMMANFIALDLRQARPTLYRGIERVPSRSVVQIDQSAATMRRYWAPRLDAPAPYSSVDDYVERARELFDVAVKRCIADLPRVAISTSGGYDSSAIAATAARLGHPDITCYTAVPTDNIGIPADRWRNRYLDERPKVDALGRLYPALRTRYLAPSKPHPFQEDPRRLFVRTAIPMRGVANINWFIALENAVVADGHRALLSGMMGNISLTWHGAFSLAALLRHGRYVELLRQARVVARNDGRSFWRVLIGEAFLKLLPLTVQRSYTRAFIGDPADVSRICLLKAEAREMLGLDRTWQADGFDPYYRLFGSAFDVRSQFLFDQGQIHRDLSAARYYSTGCEYRYPYLDRDLVEFCLSVPEWLYRHNGIPRWFARQVFADRLPPEILNETRRGEQVPNWFDFLNARKAAIAEEVERMEASPMTRRLIDIPRAKRLVAEWPKDALDAQDRYTEYRVSLDRAVHVAQFIRWVEGGNA